MLLDALLRAALYIGLILLPIVIVLLIAHRSTGDGPQYATCPVCDQVALDNFAHYKATVERNGRRAPDLIILSRCNSCGACVFENHYEGMRVIGPDDQEWTYFARQERAGNTTEST